MEDRAAGGRLNAAFLDRRTENLADLQGFYWCHQTNHDGNAGAVSIFAYVTAQIYE